MDERLSAYHGLHKNHVIADYGPPDQVLSDGGDGEIWIYQEEVVSVQSGSKQTYLKNADQEDAHAHGPDENVVLTPPKESVRLNNISFFITQAGYVYESGYGSRSIRR